MPQIQSVPPRLSTQREQRMKSLERLALCLVDLTNHGSRPGSLNQAALDKLEIDAEEAKRHLESDMRGYFDAIFELTCKNEAKKNEGDYSLAAHSLSLRKKRRSNLRFLHYRV